MGYAAGSKVINAVTATAASSSAMDNADTELAALLGPRDLWVPTSAAQGANWSFSAENDPPRWTESAQSGSLLFVPLPVWEGMVIDEIQMHIGESSVGGETVDGYFKVYRRQFDAAATKAVVATLDDTDPWDVNSTNTVVSYSSLAITIAAGYEYWLELQSVGDGTGTCYFYGARLVDAQLGA